MLSNLGQGALIYILDKNKPEIHTAEVVQVMPSMPNYNLKYQTGFLPKPSVNIKATMDGNDVMFQNLPADANIADDGNGMTVSENSDLILKEINNLKQNSQRILEQIEFHKGMVVKCDELLVKLDPQKRADAERNKEIEGLKTQISEMHQLLHKLLDNKNE